MHAHNALSCAQFEGTCVQILHIHNQEGKKKESSNKLPHCKPCPQTTPNSLHLGWLGKSLGASSNCISGLESSPVQSTSRVQVL